MQLRASASDACVDQIRPAEQIDKAVAGGKAEARLPFRLGHLRKGNFCCRHGRFLHRKSPAIERTRPAGVSSKAFRLTAGGSRIRTSGPPPGLVPAYARQMTRHPMWRISERPLFSERD